MYKGAVRVGSGTPFASWSLARRLLVGGIAFVARRLLDAVWRVVWHAVCW